MTTSAMIHIVDDDASFRTAVGDLLIASGYRVSLYESAQEFLKNPTQTNLLAFCWTCKWPA